MEEWRLVNIDDYDGKYSVSSLGRVRNNDTGDILKPHEIKGGYLRVNLYPRGNSRNGAKRRLVHRVVAFAFLHDTYIDGVTTDVNHINGDKHNNTVENLEWCTREYNNNYGTRIERMNKKVYCLELHKIFPSIREASRQLGLYQESVSRCCNGIYKTSGGYHFKYIDIIEL